jgi:hypothetical protein
MPVVHGNDILLAKAAKNGQASSARQLAHAGEAVSVTPDARELPHALGARCPCAHTTTVAFPSAPTAPAHAMPAGAIR